MKKAVLISIKPEWVCKILNGEKTIEVRKTAPKCELPVTVYIYCTKSNKRRWYLQERYDHSTDETLGCSTPYYTYTKVGEIMTPRLDGKVVAKFTLDGIDKFTEGLSCFEYERLTRGETDKSVRPYYKKALKRACLTDEELQRYAPDRTFYAWHISDLEIFDQPKELDEFGLKRVPQSWFYLEERK